MKNDTVVACMQAECSFIIKVGNRAHDVRPGMVIEWTCKADDKSDLVDHLRSLAALIER